MIKYFFLSVLFFLITYCSYSQDFITEWTNVTSEVSFFAQTSGEVNYIWTAIPSGQSGSSSFTQTAPNTLVTLSGLTAVVGDTIILSLEPQNLLRFHNAKPSPIQVNPDRWKLINVIDWGTVNWTSLQYQFFGCSNLLSLPLNPPNLSSVSDMSYMFQWANKFNSAIDSWDVSNVTNMFSTFKNATDFNHPLNTWDVSNVTNMSFMFDGAQAFNQPLNSWNVSNVEYMYQMFQNAISFNQPLNGWDVSNVISMGLMFKDAQNFDQPLNEWDVSNVIYMQQMFSFADSFNQPLNSWDVSNVEDFTGMFLLNGAFNQQLDLWELSPNADLESIFNFSTIDCNNYSATLSGWAYNNNTPNNLDLDATNLEYGTNVVAARNILLNTKNWSISGDIPSSNICSFILPVTWSKELRAIKKNDITFLSFSVAQQVNNSHFLLQHSADGQSFRTIGKLEGEGTTIVEKDYEFTHADPVIGQNYYRIKQVDFDGEFEYSNVVHVDIKYREIVVSPNPFKDEFSISTTQELDFVIYNLLGKQIKNGNTREKKVVEISNEEAGIYTISFSNGVVKRVVKM